MNLKEPVRAVSWWLTWKDLQWPDDDVAEAIERRADAAARSGVTCAVIFGAHFRWDYLPLWQNLHDLIGTIRTSLHQRNITLFDHHSAVLTHRYSTREEAQAIRTFNKHHVPFAPSRDVASTWTFNGELLDSWRMIDISTGKPVFLKPYTAEEFCINNPGFRQAYCEYVKRLVSSTGIDGLMSDDGCFYSGWTSCGCQWCRKKFKEKYGHDLPGMNDAAFWGNYSNEAFKDWIEMRFASSREFLEVVRGVLDEDYPLMACCSSSANSEMPKFGLTYQELCNPCNYIMLEMTGDSPQSDGRWNTHFSEQLLHLGLAREHKFPCLGLGYGYTEETAGFIWAFNKFLGSSTWFSTLKGRLGLPDSQITELKDDPELTGKPFNWEKMHPELFVGDTDTGTAVFFSRWTRDYCGITKDGHSREYDQTCLDLLESNITFDVVVRIPEEKKYKNLVIASAQCLDDSEYAALNRFIENGGCVIACGAVGTLDKRANRRNTPWLSQYGISASVNATQEMAAPRDCGGMEIPSGWVAVRHGTGRLFWTDKRNSGQEKIDFPSIIRQMETAPIDLSDDSCRNWRFRIFTDRSNRLIVHALAVSFKVEMMEELERMRKNPNGNHLISGIRRTPASPAVLVKLNRACSMVKYYAPSAEKEELLTPREGKLHIHVPEDVYYFILEMTPDNP